MSAATNVTAELLSDHPDATVAVRRFALTSMRMRFVFTMIAILPWIATVLLTLAAASGPRYEDAPDGIYGSSATAVANW